MKHYEIVLVIHPDQGGQISTMFERYQQLITQHGGKVHRFEDWGRRQLAYLIQNLSKAHYVLMNIECDIAVLRELEYGFKFNDAILRSLILSRDRAITEPSPMLREEKSKTPEPSYVV